MAAYAHGPGIDDPLIMNYDGSDYFFHKNHLGSITEITDIYQNTVKTYDYDAFGTLLVESGSLDHNAFTYTGREYHSRSGLYYYRARFYDPQTGRFITPDPIGHAGGINLYAYIANNPARYIDPLGLGTLLFGSGGSAVIPAASGPSGGVEGSVGAFIHTDSNWGGFAVLGAQLALGYKCGRRSDHMGFFGSLGYPDMGLNISSDLLFIGYVRGNLGNVSGRSLNINLVLFGISVTGFLNEEGELIGGTVGFGPGIPLKVQGSGAVNDTRIITVGEIADFWTKQFKRVSN